MIIFLQITGGLILLLAGGEVLVRGAVALANKLGISPLIIGLTIVAIGTSAPEIIVSIQAALSGHPDIAVGNIFGSNIANIFLVMGVTAIIFPIAINPSIKKYDAPALLLITLIAAFFCWNDQEITRFEGIALIVFLMLYTVNMIRVAKKAEKKEYPISLSPESCTDSRATSCNNSKIPLESAKADSGNDGVVSGLKSSLFILTGIILLAYGSTLLVDGAVSLAKIFNISEAVIGATLVAVGSSAPELATCIIAAFRKHSDIAAGNVVGSNLLNIMAGLSSAAVITPLAINDSFMRFDIWVFLAATLMLFLAINFCKNINRFIGGVFFIFYIAYISMQFVN